MLIETLAVGAALGIAGYAIWERQRGGRALVVGALRRAGITDFEVSTKWFDRDRDTITYDVTYTVAGGHRVRNSAKVTVGVHNKLSLFWEHSL
jgi:hypothetical protein